MQGTDYVVRTWSLTPAGNSRATVVDRFGRIVHVTVHRAHAPHADVDGLIRDRLAQLPAPRRPHS
jgi:hypothetical protein